MNFQNAFAATNVGPRDDNATIETTRSKQCRIQNIRPVRRGDQNHAIVRFKAVHFDKQLIQSLLALVVTAAKTRAAMPTNCVDLVDEDDARRVLLALLEQIAHPRGADADEHFDEIRTGD